MNTMVHNQKNTTISWHAMVLNCYHIVILNRVTPNNIMVQIKAISHHATELLS